jgi:hypothetical protein
MANHEAITDLLLCAEMILDYGAPSESVRETPPISQIVGNDALRNLILSREESNAIKQSLDALLEPEHAKQEDRKSKRL